MEESQIVSGPSAPDHGGSHATLSTDVVIIGGGLAGSLAGAMLGRAGTNCVVVDPHREYPPDFRCEKLDGDQVARLQKTGLAAEILSAATFDGEAWVARKGVIVDKRPGDQHGIFYSSLVNRVRSLIPPSVHFCQGTARRIETSADRQSVTLSDATVISARLAVLSNGLGLTLRDQLGLTRDCISHDHSLTFGFNIKPVERRHFDRRALTFYAKSPSDRTALLTIFPIGSAMRANLFTYRTIDDPWVSGFRRAPEDSLRMMMPELEQMIGSFVVEKPIQMRPVDLCATQGHVQAGLVLVGDAFATSCPASGNGARKVITDVERLCNVYIPQWLATPEMGAEKISHYYADPIKCACDRSSLEKALSLKLYSIDTAPIWRMRRNIRFAQHLALGSARRTWRRLSGHVLQDSDNHAFPARSS